MIQYSISQSFLSENMDNAESENSKTISELEQLLPKDLMEANDFMLLQRVVKKINSRLGREELLQQIVQDVSETLGFNRCAVLIYVPESGQLEIAALTGWEDGTFYPGYKLCKNEGIVWKAIREQRIIYIPDVKNLPGETPCDFTSRSHLDIPLYHHGKLIGILNAQSTKVGAFSKHDLRILKTLASHISIAIENSRLFEIEKYEKEKMKSDLKEAKEIQSRMFPKTSPIIDGFTINGLCEPCQEVGGDWFDYIELPSGKTGIVLADVAGKGLSAAFLMSSARTIFRIIAKSELSPSEVLKKVNEYLIEDLPPTRFITMIYLIIDPVKGKLTISNAGHLLPVHKSGDSVKQLKFESGFPLGIKKHDYSNHEFFLKKGEQLFLYSDGVSEATNAKDEFFDEKNIYTSLQKDDADLVTVFNDVKNYIGNSEQSDDITLVEIKSEK